ncbi:hypothetical protein [Neptunicella sp. SCSIO 80796]|uniref:hypothetical protein n=1 Tax=Neptunicella plasticusilytica TaxID=3117012 RepID=UPI003A4E5046
MSTKIKLAIDVIGIIITLTGFGLLVADEKYLISGLLLLIALVLLTYAIHLSRSKPYKVKSTLFEYEFLDPGPAKTKVVKTTIFTPLEKNIASFNDLGIGAEGRIGNISTLNGTCIVTKHGGAISATTYFDTALPVGQEYHHQISYYGSHCFPDAKENVVHSIIHNIDLAVIKIQFHQDKKPSNLKAIHTIGSQKTDITATNIKMTNLLCVLEIKKPERGSVFEIKWEW